MSQQFENLLTPMKIGKVEIKNRMVMGPIGMGFFAGQHSEFSERAIEYYEKRAKGGFGLIVSGAMSSDTELDPFIPGMMLSPLHSPMHFISAGQEMNERLDIYGSKMFPQISMGNGRNQPGAYTPSELPAFYDPSVTTNALTKDQLQLKIQRMVESAAVVQKAGFSGMEVHAMHWGYLLDEFAMSLMNHRTDEYGGTLENRMRAAKEIVTGIKQVCGEDFAVSMRLALKSYMKGFYKPSLNGEEEVGRTLEEGIKIGKMLESYGYHALNVDAGTYDSFYHAAPPMYMEQGSVIPLAAEAKKHISIPILTATRMNDPYMNENAIAESSTDAVVMARQTLADPNYGKKIEMGEPESIRPCIACNQGCIARLFNYQNPVCAVNPSSSESYDSEIKKVLDPKNITVIGGGVAGMEFARTSALKGHSVTLYEKTEQLGGELIPGGKHDFKKDMRHLNGWYQNELQNLGVKIQLGRAMTPEEILTLNSDVVALCVGANSVIPPIPGVEQEHVLTSIEALNDEERVGDNVVVVGGGLVGCELAYDLAKEGKKVTLIEALEDILSSGVSVPMPNKMMLNDLLADNDVNTLRGARLISIDASSVCVSTADGDIKIEADNVILAIGFIPKKSMAPELHGRGIEIYELGDGYKVGSVGSAVRSAFTAANSIN